MPSIKPFFSPNHRSESISNLTRSILIEASPLTIKQIHQKITRDFDRSVSYQAVHKAIRELLADGSILANDKKYQLNPEWVRKGKKHFQDLEDRLYNESSPKYKEFDCLYDCYRYILEIGFKATVGHQKIVVAALQLEHIYSILTISKEEYQMFETIFKREGYSIYITCKNNTLVDQAMATFYRLGGMNVKLGIPLHPGMDTIAIEGSVIQILFPTELKKELDTIYSKATIFNILQKNFFHFLYKKTPPIKIFIQDNPQLATEIIEQTKKYFKKNSSPISP